MSFRLPRIGGVQNFNDEVEFTAAALRTSVGRIVAEVGLGGYEPETIGAAIALVQAERLDSFADIGANIGIFSLVLKSIFGDGLDVDAFEPLPRLNEIAASLASLNSLRLDVHREALSNTAGTAKFYVSAKSDSSNSLNADFRAAKEVIDVQLATIDEFFAEQFDRSWLMKVDTESTEPDVLEGGAKFIASGRPWIICEVLANRGEERLQRIVDQHGYFAYHLDGGQMEEPAKIEGDPTYRCRDWLFAPKQLDTQFRQLYAETQAALRDIHP